MRRAKVVLTDYVWDALDVEREILGPDAELVSFKAATTDQFAAAAADCDALLNTYAGPISADVIAAMPRCKIIARYGIGVDTIDLDAATTAGIIVTNNPTYCIDEVADHTLALILGAARKIALFDRRVRAGEWSLAPGKPIERLRGMVLGLVGFGRIAREVAARAAPFGLRVIFSDPGVDEAPSGIPGEKRSFDNVLAAADIVSLHAPLTANTRGMIDAAAFQRMKRSAILVNASRGALVDTTALVAALDGGEIAGCALDTLDVEPLPAAHALRGRDDVLITPHAAWYSETAMVGLQAGAPGEVRRVLSGAWPVNVVNPAVRGRNRAGLSAPGEQEVP